MSEATVLKVQLGCGLVTPVGWINVDGSWNARLAKYPGVRRFLTYLHVLPAEFADIAWSRDILCHDVRKPLPFSSNSIHIVYSSHLLEHLYRDEAQQLLRECYRVLAVNGVVRLVVPDLLSIVKEYIGDTTIDGQSDSISVKTPADRMNERLLLRNPAPPRGNVFYQIYSSLTDFHSHKWMYDAESLIGHLRQAGFSAVAEMKFCESRIAGIEEIEQPGRVLDGAGICVEGVKLAGSTDSNYPQQGV